MAAAVAAGSGVAGAAQQQQPSGEPLLTDPNVIIRRYQAMQQECQALAGKVRAWVGGLGRVRWVGSTGRLGLAGSTALETRLNQFPLSSTHITPNRCRSWRWSWASTSWW